MPFLAAIPAMIGLASSIFGAKKAKKAQNAAQAAATVPFGTTNLTGTGGFGATAGTGGFGYNLGALSKAFGQGVDLSALGSGAALNALNGAPANVQTAADAFAGQDLGLDTLTSLGGGANALSLAALSQAFGGGADIGGITSNALTNLRAAAAPQNARAMQSFIQGLYSTGRGAVTGAPGSEDTLGGGALSAAFARGLANSDLDLQNQAQAYGIAGANAQSDLLTQAFARYGDQANLAANLNTLGFNRQNTFLQQNLTNQGTLSQLPIQMAAAFQSLGGQGLTQATNLTNLGLNAAGAALNNQTAISNAARGSATNLVNLATQTSASPLADAFGTFATAAAPQGWFQNLFKKTTQPVPAPMPGSNGEIYYPPSD